MKLKNHVNRQPGLPDLLNYAHFVEEGILIHKDGAFLMTYQFKGNDTDSASQGELDALTASINRMLTFLGDGWMLHVDELRVPSLRYPTQGAFPDPVSALIDEERRQYYEQEGRHFENLQFFTFVWKFPLPLIKTTRHWFIEGLPAGEGKENLSVLLTQFTERVERCLNLLQSHCWLEWLNSASLLSFLNTCITGELLPVAVPENGCFIDVVLGRRALVKGFVPRIGNASIIVISILGYLNKETAAGVLDNMMTYPMVYRWSNRFIPMSQATAERQMKRFQKKWHNAVKGLLGIVKEVLSGKESEKKNNDAYRMEKEVDEALTTNKNGCTRWGYWSSEVVLIHEDRNALADAQKALSRHLEQAGFACKVEDVNAVDAWLGTLPGHGSSNLRRVFINGLSLAHVLPLHSTWTGAPTSASSSLLPKGSPPVFYAATTGNTPFRLHLDVGDVGHQVIIGPTGAGKTTYLSFLIAQFFRYEGAQVFLFDKDKSHLGLIKAMKGDWFDIGANESLGFSPLSDIVTDSARVRASQFIEELVLLQGTAVTPEIRSAIHTAMVSLSGKAHENSRNLTVFQGTVQNEAVRNAIQYYTLRGSFSLLDAAKDSLNTSPLQCFEMGWLLNQKPAVYCPVLKHIFNQIEGHLERGNGKHPTLIVLEEAWLYIGHEMFSTMLRDWLKTLRKKNARVVFATQSLSDLYDPSTQRLTKTTAAIMESCFTKVYLPNPGMESETKSLYLNMGLSERQVEVVMNATPKRHYYIVTPEGHRLIELGLKMPLAFVGLSKEKTENLIQCQKTHGDDWVYHWLVQQGYLLWADHWKAEQKKGAVA